MRLFEIYYYDDINCSDVRFNVLAEDKVQVILKINSICPPEQRNQLRFDIKKEPKDSLVIEEIPIKLPHIL